MYNEYMRFSEGSKNMRKLIIHDLSESQCQELGLDQMGNNNMIIDSKQISNYCIGCFGC